MATERQVTFRVMGCCNLVDCFVFLAAVQLISGLWPAAWCVADEMVPPVSAKVAMDDTPASLATRIMAN